MDRDDRLLRVPRPESVLAAAYLAILAWAPFPYGSTAPWAELVLGGGLGAVMLAWSGLALTGFAPAPVAMRRLALPVICTAAALLWAVVQSTDLAVVQHLTGIDVSTLAHPVWTTAATALGRETGAFISIDPESTHRAIFVSATGATAFLLALQLGRDRDRAQLLLAGIAALTAFYAAAAIAGQVLAADDVRPLLLPGPPATPAPVPFAIAGDAAIFMALGALAGLGLFAETARQAATWDRGPRVALRTAARAAAANIVWLAAVSLLLAALVLSRSQTGVVTFLVGALALLVALAVGRRASEGEAAGQRAVAAVFVTAIGVAAAFIVVPLPGGSDIDERDRAALTETTLRAIENAPVLGSGFGAFQAYAPMTADGALPAAANEARNDVLETVADLGVPAGIAFMAAPVLLAGMCFAGCLNRRRDRLYPAVGFAASVVVGVNALVASGLQVPAIAVAYAALLGLGVAQSWRTSMDAVR